MQFADKDLSLEALVLYYLYPRLDANVSTGINHLLKSPFCIHPKTGNICVCFDPESEKGFQLNKVPNLTTVINELGEVNQRKKEADAKEASTLEDGGVAVIPSLNPYVTIFKKHIRSCNLKSDQFNKKIAGDAEDF